MKVNSSKSCHLNACVEIRGDHAKFAILVQMTPVNHRYFSQINYAILCAPML